MNERDITDKILKHLKTVPRCFAWKEHGGMYGTAGLPDIIACIDGRFFGFEVKQPGKEPTLLQAKTITKITAAGGNAHVVTSLEQVLAILKENGGQ